MTPATTDSPRLDRAEAYAKITHRIYEDRRASPQARALLLAVAYALCIAPGDPGRVLNTTARAPGRSPATRRPRLDALVADDAPATSRPARPATVARQNALLEQHLTAGSTLFLDSTNVEVLVRADLVERAPRHNRPIGALRFLPDLSTCLARNAQRPPGRRVPPDTLRWQHHLAREATPDALLREGFTAVHQVGPS
ncbi:AAA family ATPase [Streptomyces sp. DT197]|uniref:AAA family ATPase n=1 Tax=Streptomyces sp. DT197 TaxID=3393417 RepID=UPI003CEF3ACB